MKKVKGSAAGEGKERKEDADSSRLPVSARRRQMASRSFMDPSTAFNVSDIAQKPSEATLRQLVKSMDARRVRRQRNLKCRCPVHSSSFGFLNDFFSAVLEYCQFSWLLFKASCFDLFRHAGSLQEAMHSIQLLYKVAVRLRNS